MFLAENKNNYRKPTFIVQNDTIAIINKDFAWSNFVLDNLIIIAFAI